MFGDERGQTIAEYATALGVIVVAVVLVLAALSTSIGSKIQAILDVFPH